MSFPATSSFLRRALVADAGISGAAGLLMLFGADVLEGGLAVPAEILRYAGFSLLPFAALLVYLTRRERLPRGVVQAVIGLNALWVVGSVLLLLSGWIAPNGLGYAFILVQAVAVAGFTEMQYVALRRVAATA
ncbi:MAG: hypothetical protein GEU99_06615 [Luteitalea sp.]|nr:hypothetical protein [Luteitalea sp.]